VRREPTLEVHPSWVGWWPVQLGGLAINKRSSLVSLISNDEEKMF